LKPAFAEKITVVLLVNCRWQGRKDRCQGVVEFISKSFHTPKKLRWFYWLIAAAKAFRIGLKIRRRFASGE